MKSFFKLLDRTLYCLIFLILALMVSVVAANVFGRFVVGKSLSWGEEVAKILLAYLTFLGAAYAMRDNSHYAFDFLIQKLPHNMLRYFLAFRWFAVLSMSLLLLIFSAEATIKIRDWIMPSTGINRALVYGVEPVSLFFLILYALRNFIADIRNPQLHIKEEVMDN